VSSNRSGIWNAYTIPTAGGEAEPLTGRILYTSDEGGNELSHLFVRNDDDPLGWGSQTVKGFRIVRRPSIT
jgi:hypothetical protein